MTEHLDLMLIKHRQWQIFNTVGKKGTGMDLAFKWISKIINDKANLKNKVGNKYVELSVNDNNMEKDELIGEDKLKQNNNSNNKVKENFSQNRFCC